MIKSQSDLNPCNDGKRSSDVLLATVAKCERLQKQLDIALSSMRDSRELLYQLSQILAADAIGKQLQEIKELDK